MFFNGCQPLVQRCDGNDTSFRSNWYICLLVAFLLGGYRILKGRESKQPFHLILTWFLIIDWVQSATLERYIFPRQKIGKQFSASNKSKTNCLDKEPNDWHDWAQAATFTFRWKDIFVHIVSELENSSQWVQLQINPKQYKSRISYFQFLLVLWDKKCLYRKSGLKIKEISQRKNQNPWLSP